MCCYAGFLQAAALETRQGNTGPPHTQHLPLRQAVYAPEKTRPYNFLVPSACLRTISNACFAIGSNRKGHPSRHPNFIFVVTLP